jgi:hypothetical protein
MRRIISKLWLERKRKHEWTHYNFASQYYLAYADLPEGHVTIENNSSLALQDGIALHGLIPH